MCHFLICEAWDGAESVRHIILSFFFFFGMFMLALVGHTMFGKVQRKIYIYIALSFIFFNMKFDNYGNY